MLSNKDSLYVKQPREIATEIISTLILKLNGNHHTIQSATIVKLLEYALNQGSEQAVKDALLAGKDLYDKYGDLVMSYKETIRKSVFE